MSKDESVTREQVLAVGSRVPWESYAPAFLLDGEVRAIRRISVEPPAKVQELLAARNAEALLYPQALLKALQNITDVRVIQFSLTLLRDFVEADPDRRARLVTRAGDAAGRMYALPLLQLVGTSGSGARILSQDAHPYVLEQAALCAASLVAADASDEAATSGLFSWVLTNLKLFGSPSPRQVRVTEVAVETLMVLLRSEYLRALFLEEKGVERLIPLLAARNAQLLYDVAFCFWLISLHRPSGAGGRGSSSSGGDSSSSSSGPVLGVDELERGGTVAALARICRVGMPLKVMRMAMACLANMARAPSAVGSETLAQLAETHLPEIVVQLMAIEPHIADAEMNDDLKWLRDAMAAASNSSSAARPLTSVDRLERELAHGRLEWGPVHTAEFWRDNASHVERDGDFTVVKQLVALLKDTGADDVTHAVALFDLGAFAAAHPQGRAILVSLGAKPLVIDFLKRAEDDVKHQALLTLSKMVVTRWQFLGSGVGAAGPNGVPAAAADGKRV